MEGAILLMLQSIRIDGLTQLLVLLSSFANSALIWIVIGIALLVFSQHKDSGILLIATVVIIGVLFYLILSNVVARPRPTDVVQGLTAVIGVSHDGYSFPNFHALTCFAATTVLWRASGARLFSFSLLYSVIVCLCQLYFGVAYPTDLLAGAALGIVFALVISYAYGRLFGLIDNAGPARGAHSRY